MTARTSSFIRSARSRCWLVLLLAAGVCRVGWADPVAPGANDTHITMAVASLLSRQHLSHHPLDQEMSQRCLKSFLKALDPMKLYFYQADIDEFAKSRDDLSNAIRRGDVSFAYTVFRRFLQRVDERVNLADQLLAEQPDFTVDEEMVIDRDAAQYSRDLPAARDTWRRRIKYDLLALEADKKMVGKKAYYRLVQRYHSFAKQMHQVDNNELLEIYLNSFTTAFDPHTDYMSPDAFRNFEIMMSLELEGIGALLTSEDGYTTVKHILPGGSAEKNGQLKNDDKIIGVGEGEAGEMLSVIDMKLSKVVKLIRGQPGTTVRLDVVSGDESQRKLVRIVPREDRPEGQRGKGFPGGPQGGWHALPHRRDRRPQLLPQHGRRPPGRDRLQECHPRRGQSAGRLPPAGRRRRDPRPPLQRRRIVARGHQPDWAVYRRRAHRAGKGRGRQRAPPGRRRPGRGLAGTARGVDQQVQR